MRDLAALAASPCLRELSLQFSGVSDVSPLFGCARLRRVKLGGHGRQDIHSLLSHSFTRFSTRDYVGVDELAESGVVIEYDDGDDHWVWWGGQEEYEEEDYAIREEYDREVDSDHRAEYDYDDDFYDY